MKFAIFMVLLIAATIANSNQENSYGRQRSNSGSPSYRSGDSYGSYGHSGNGDFSPDGWSSVNQQDGTSEHSRNSTQNSCNNSGTHGDSSDGSYTPINLSSWEYYSEFSEFGSEWMNNDLQEQLQQAQQSQQEMKHILGNEEMFSAIFDETLATIDTDGNGYIDEDELQAAFTMLAHEEGVQAPSPEDTFGLLQWFDANQDGVLQDHEVMVCFRYLLTTGIWQTASTIGWLQIQLGVYQLSPLPDGEDLVQAAEHKLDELYTLQANEYDQLFQLETLLYDRDILQAELENAWIQNDTDYSGDLSHEEAYNMVISLCHYLQIEAPSQEDFTWGFDLIDTDQSLTISDDEFQVAVDTFLVPALVDTFVNLIISTTQCNAEIDQIYMSGIFGDWVDCVEEDPYWQGYEHGFDDGYVQGFFDGTGNYPWELEQFEEPKQDYNSYGAQSSDAHSSDNEGQYGAPAQSNGYGTDFTEPSSQAWQEVGQSNQDSNSYGAESPVAHSSDNEGQYGATDALDTITSGWNQKSHKKLLQQKLADDINVAKLRSKKSGNPFRNNGKKQKQTQRKRHL